MPDRKDLEKLLGIIKIWANDDEWFKNELSKDYGVDFHAVNGNIVRIKEFLEINCNQSINYNFIENNFLRNQLEIDNLRMENCCLDLKEKNEEERFYNFCVNAFYQVENLINYHFFMMYPVFEDLLIHIETATKFVRSKEKNLGEIPISSKIFAYGKSYFNQEKDYTGQTLLNLSKVRNNSLHRCTIIKNNESEDSNLFKFFKHNTFSTVRNTLQKFVASIKENTK
jgi:hypothetical protein